MIGVTVVNQERDFNNPEISAIASSLRTRRFFRSEDRRATEIS
jgi:hypothetical protein